MDNQPEITVRRITSIAQVTRLWPFFAEGLDHEARYLKYPYPLDVYRRILFHLVYKNPNAWVGVALLGTEPVAFVMSHDSTPLFTKSRQFDVSMFYYRRNCGYALRDLQDRLDTFCRENGIDRYYITTTSFTSSAQRVFGNFWTGLTRSNTVFKRKVT